MTDKKTLECEIEEYALGIEQIGESFEYPCMREEND